jgi:thiamine biosynthesis lipoprotein
VLRAGYTTSFDTMGGRGEPGLCDLVIGCTDIQIDGKVVRLPAGTGFDPGGIGKGLAADLTAAEVSAAGADGVCINMGGDLRCIGRSPDGGGWTVAIEHPWSARPLALVGVGEGAVATSTTLRRRWTSAGRERHHLIDPRTGEPSTTDLNLASVIAGTAWAAEVLAKAVLLRGSEHPFDLVDGCGAHALVVDDDGKVAVSEGFHAFVGVEGARHVGLARV